MLMLVDPMYVLMMLVCCVSGKEELGIDCVTVCSVVVVSRGVRRLVGVSRDLHLLE